MQDLGIDKLGPFPLLQLAAAMAILAGLALAIYKGTRDRKLSPDQDGSLGAVRWYFDGPLNAALQTLRDIYKVMCSTERHVEPYGEELRTHTRLLEEIKQKQIEIKDLLIRLQGHGT